jgi:hypothetical protein
MPNVALHPLQQFAVVFYAAQAIPMDIELVGVRVWNFAWRWDFDGCGPF